MNIPLKKLGLTTALRFSGVILQTLVIMLVGRLVGPAGVGALQLFLTWTCSLGETVAAGLPTQTMRQFANLEADKDRARLYLYTAWRRMAVLWSVLAVIATSVWLLGLETTAFELLLIGLSVFCFAFYRIASEGLKSFRDVDFSVLVESSLPPLVTGATLMLMVGFEQQLTTPIVLLAFTLGFVFTALVIAWRMNSLLGKTSPSRVSTCGLPWKEHFPFWVGAIVSIVFLNFPFFVLPYYATLEEVGAFALAFKLLNICTTILLLLGAIYGPKFSRLSEKREFDAALKLLVMSRKLSIAAFLPLSLLLIILYPLVHAWFGEGFEGGFQFLLILLVGQLFNAATGLSGQFLNMAGAGSIEMKVQVFGLLLAIMLTPVFGTEFGAAGIAMVYSATVVVRSLGSLWFANRLLSPHHHLVFRV